MWLVWLLSCGDPARHSGPAVAPATPPVVQSASDSGEPPVEDPAPDPVDPPDLVAVTAAVQAAIDAVPLLSITPCFDRYHELAEAAATRACPIVTSEGDTRTWFALSCTTAGGASFNGGLVTFADVTWVAEDRLLGDFLNVYGPAYVPGYTPSPTVAGAVTGEAMEGMASVDTSDGAWALNAYAWGADVADRGLRARYLGVEGTCDASRPTGSLWVDSDLAPWIGLVQLWVDDGTLDGGADRHTWVHGGLDGLSAAEGAEGYDTVTFADVTLVPPALGGSCALEPVGLLEVRDDQGDLWTVDLTTPETAGACDGCAGLRGPDGAIHGEICADYAPLLRPIARTVPR